MPEPGQTPTPQIKQGKGPDALPWGEAAEVNDLVGLAPPEEDPYQPQGDAEQFLFSPTDRPGEPFSAGLPFGAGPDGVPQPSDQDVVIGAAKKLAAVPNPPREVKAFLAKMAEGL